MDECARCNTRWFDQHLSSQQICRKCNDADRRKADEEPFFYSQENHLDFGDVPEYLPELSQVEEMLIARAHVHVQLPEDGNVASSVLNEIVPDVDIEETVDEADLPAEDDFDGFAVPNMITGQTELEELRSFLEQEPAQPNEQVPLREAEPRSEPYILDLEQLRAAFVHDTPESATLLKSIVRYSGSIRGTRPFWIGKRQGLEAMVRGLGCPGTFMTFSAADVHWDSLHRHMPNYEQWLAADHREKMRIATSNLRDNPHIAAYHFHHRFTQFLKFVLKLKLNIIDHCLSTEFNDAVTKLTFEQAWGTFVSAFNPEPTRPMIPAAEAIMPKISSRQPLVSFVSKFMNKIAIERDWSAQELLRSEVIEDTGVRATVLLYEKYLRRSDEWESLIYFTSLTQIDHNQHTWRPFPIAANRILNYFPRYRSEVEHGTREDYCRIRLMLHHPYQSVDQLKIVEGEVFETFTAAFEYCEEVHQGAYPDDYYTELPPAQPLDFEEEPGEEEELP
ncbi:unnamed protein product [Clonostachys rhizophaga]|uniref:Helitron helicase-like domain-containing protein n=1 Tax=Clonostachys rhizophaga TaxID=160324 RepID=A0A9N9YS81_9HYPO|nr:unnamed protein product [Clonostachys rhizophaga]